MRLVTLLIAAIFVAAPAFGEDALPAVANLAFAMKPGDASHYNIRVQMTGKSKFPGETQAVPIDTVLSMGVGLTVGTASNDGAYPVFITSDAATATVGGQPVALTPDLFPKLTVLMDKVGAITGIFPPDANRAKQPGINYRNFILLFNPNAPAGDIKPGATWKKTVTVGSAAQKYDMSYKLESIEKIGETPTAKVKADLVLVPAPGSGSSAKGVVTSNYSLDGARLLKSHAEITVKTTTPAPKAPADADAADGPGDLDAVVKVDITRSAPAAAVPTKP